MTCTRCGSWQSEANVGHRFCSNCGATLPIATYAQPGVHQDDQPTSIAPVYPGYYDDAVPGLVHEPVSAPARAAAPAPARDWMRHPGTWVIAATALLVAGIVLAAVIVSSGGSGNGDNQAAAGSPSTSASASAVATTSAAPPSTAPPSTATQTVIVVPAAPGTPAETRTVTVAPEQPTGSGSGPFGGATQVEASYYQRGSTVYFDSPSHNIGCRLVSGGAQAQCTIEDYDFTDPGYDCPRGAGVLMNAGDTPTLDCIHNPAYGGESALEYGESVTFGGFSCVSQSSGITCVDAYSTGFTLSREAYTEY